MTKQIRMALIGSGSESTGAAAIDAFQRGEIPSVSNIVAFISTVPEAGLLSRAAERNVLSFAIDDSQRRDLFQAEVLYAIERLEIDLLVSAGCRAMLPNSDICMVNTHPEEKELHGGHHMVGLAPHLHFLEHEIIDKLWRGRANVETEFAAKITFHYINGYKSIDSVTSFDTGLTIMEVPIPIPRDIIERAWRIRQPCRHRSGHWDWDREKMRREAMDNLAQEIQNHVLIHERQLLPKFIETIAKLIATS